jgi:hypothetical protein
MKDLPKKECRQRIMRHQAENSVVLSAWRIFAYIVDDT